MGNKIKDIDIKQYTNYFLMILSIPKSLIQVILKQIKSHGKIFLFTTLDMWRSKIQNM